MSITLEEKNALVADGIVHRQKEIGNYDIEKGVKETQLASAPAEECPEEFKMWLDLDDVTIAKKAAAENVDIDVVFPHILKHRTKSEINFIKTQRMKSAAMHDALVSQIPDKATRDGLVEAARVKANTVVE